jgi:hypothetical protein
MWLSSITFFHNTFQIVLATVSQVKSEGKSPGKTVTQIKSISSIFVFEFCKTFSKTSKIELACSLAAISGTTPQVASCIFIWLLVSIKSNFSSSKTAIEVSSQLVSIARIFIKIF